MRRDTLKVNDDGERGNGMDILGSVTTVVSGNWAENCTMLRTISTYSLKSVRIDLNVSASCLQPFLRLYIGRFQKKFNDPWGTLPTLYPRFRMGGPEPPWLHNVKFMCVKDGL